MREITVMDPHRRIGAGLVRFGKAHPSDTTAELRVTNHTAGQTGAVWLDHDSAVWLMAALGLFVADPGATPFGEIAARDPAGFLATIARLDHDGGPIAALHVTAHLNQPAVSVAIDQRMATALMAQLGAFVATT